MSVSKTHAHVVVAADGALVVTDRGSTNGSTVVRQGMPRPLPAGRPTTLLEGDVVTLGDRTMTVHRIERGRPDPT
jgi:pSer/pThr/pTyr-binding forkhead associated (FHA) protein